MNLRHSFTNSIWSFARFDTLPFKKFLLEFCAVITSSNTNEKTSYTPSDCENRNLPRLFWTSNNIMVSYSKLDFFMA